MKALLLRLANHKIEVRLQNGNLKLSVPDGVDASGLLEEIRANKDGLIQYLTENMPSAQRYSIIPKAPEKEYYRLSAVQQRLYYLYALDRTNSIHMPQVLKIRGNLDLARLEDAFQKLINRHESLRTSFHVIDNHPMQKVWKEVKFNMELHRCREDGVETIVDQFVRPYDLEKAPLFRAGIIELPRQEYILMIDMNHIISDGVSEGVLFSELLALYNREHLPEINIHYKDFAEWQQSEQQQQRIAGQKNFWLNEFSAEMTPLEIPSDFPRPPVLSQAGEWFYMILGREETRALKQIAEDEEATVFLVLLAIFNVLLSRLGNQEDVTIGTPTAGRQHPDLQSVIGMFVNTMPLRNFPVGGLSFREFLSTVKTRTLAGFDNQEYTYEELVSELGIGRDRSRNSLYDYLFVYQNFDTANITVPGLSFEAYRHHYVRSRFDITLSGTESDGEINLNFEYSTDLFTRSTMERFEGYIRNIVSAIIADINIKLSDIPMIPSSEQYTLLSRFNPAPAEWPEHKTVIRLFEEQVARTPRNCALIFNDESLTYEELNARANQLAHYLSTSGFAGKSVAGLLLDRSVEMIVAMLGIMKAGITYVPVDSDQPEERVLRMLQEAGAAFLVTDTVRCESLAPHIPCTDIASASMERYPVTDPQIPVSPSDTAYIIFTSGSTGIPKGVMIGHKGITNLICFLKEKYAFSEQDRVLQFSSISFDASVEQIWLALLNGAALVLIPKETITDNQLFNQYIIRHKVTHLDTIPSFLEHLNLPEDNYLQRITTGGEECDVQLAGKFSTPYRLFNEYGPTETTIVSVSCLITDKELQSTRLPIGYPVSNTRIYILDKNRRLLPIGAVGEIFIGGVGVAKGYVGDETLTALKFSEDPFVPGGRIYKTGDLGRWLPDGRLEFLGRIDTQVKIRGFRIELGEIANRLKSYEAIAECVVEVKQKANDKFLVVYYTAAEDLNIPEVRRFLLARLPVYMVPAYYIRLTALPLTLNGKIDRKALPEPDITPATDYVAPSTETERKLVRIWAGVLKLDPDCISVHNSFFELGGHSLNIVALSNMILAEMDVQMPIKEIFENLTIRQQSEYITLHTWLHNENNDGGSAKMEIVL